MLPHAFHVNAEGEIPRLRRKDLLPLLRRMRDCGFTVAGVASRKWPHHEVALAELEFPAFWRDWTDERDDTWAPGAINAEQMSLDAQTTVTALKDNPTFAGLFLTDEPGATEFPNVLKAIKIAQDAGTMSYSTLYPNYASESQLEVTISTIPGESDRNRRRRACEAYLGAYVTGLTVPQLVVADNYALYEPLDPAKAPTSQAYSITLLLDNLELLAKHTTPPGQFWLAAVVTAFLLFREVTEADLRFQGFATLAYGGRGISWYQYFPRDWGNYRGAPLDHANLETENWEKLRRVNSQLSQYGNRLLPYRWMHAYEVMVSGDPINDPDLFTSNTPEPAILSKLYPGQREDVRHPAHYLVGEFIGDPAAFNMVLVVNMDVGHSVAVTAVLRSPTSKILHLYSPHTGQPRDIANSENWWLPPGGALLFMVGAGS